jgi:hypothetical protein
MIDRAKVDAFFSRIKREDAEFKTRRDAHEQARKLLEEHYEMIDGQPRVPHEVLNEVKRLMRIWKPEGVKETDEIYYKGKRVIEP